MMIVRLIILATVCVKGTVADPFPDESSHIREEIPQYVGISDNQHDPPLVAFTAWAQTPISYNQNDTIIFDGILVNQGSHYRPQTGRFTCPHTGVYFISVAFKRTGDSDENMRIAVKKSGQYIIQTDDYASALSSNTVSNSAIVNCSEGEEIYLEGRATGSVYGAPALPYSTFTVYLMFNQGGNENYHESFVGFTSYKAEHQYYESGDLIAFDNVIYNEGGYYQPLLHKFTCPTTGIYYISVNYHRGNSSQYLGVTQNTLTVLHSSHPDAYDNTFSNSRLLRCQQNDDITVQGTGIGSVMETTRTTFSVMLMHNEGAAKEQNSFVGFSMFKKTVQTYVAGDIIQFDGELYNDGGYYQLELNRFQCLFDGIYYFSLNLKKAYNETITVDLTQDTRIVFRLTETLGNSALHNTISNSAVIRCYAGEVIQVKAAGTGTVFGLHDDSHTTFNGFLLYQY